MRLPTCVRVPCDSFFARACLLPLLFGLSSTGCRGQGSDAQATAAQAAQPTASRHAFAGNVQADALGGSGEAENLENSMAQLADSASDAARVMVSSAMSRAVNNGNMWLHTHARDMSKAKDPVRPGIYRADNTVFMGRGAVIHDTRGCDSCNWRTGPNVAEQLKRIDILVDKWHANFLRLVTESYATADQGVTNGASRVSWQSLLQDEAYLAALKQIVDYIGTKPGVYVYISMWRDASLTTNLWPTVDSITAPGTLCNTPAFANKPTSTCTWRKLATMFRDYPYVMFGVDGEPANNKDGAQDPQVWQLMNAQVQAIRDVEDAAGTPHHIVLVQGTRDWARDISYYAKTGGDGRAVLNPITAARGDNVAYETHPYSAASKFTSLFLDAAQYLPVVVGEFGPVYMSYADMETLVNASEAAKLPYIGWSFHPNCGPASMITETTTNQCDGSNAASIAPNAWGVWLKNKMAANTTDDPFYTNPPPAQPPVVTTPTTPAPTVPAPTGTVTNLARGKNATQSSTYPGALAVRAVDNNPSGAYSAGSVSHTADRPGTTNPYWQVDLGAVHTLTQLNVFNRTDCCSERLEGVIAFISVQPFTTFSLDAMLADAGVTAIRLGKYINGATAQVTLPNAQGRYVRLMLPGTKQILALAEVQVMGV